MKVRFKELYGASEAIEAKQSKRVQEAIAAFTALYGEGEYRVFSTPGRTEVGGNHTDHNLGKVLAASVNLDVIAVVRQTSDSMIRVKSAGFEPDTVELSALSPVGEEQNTSAALIRGVAGGFRKHGYEVGGFCAYTTSNVLKGSGLSSSAAFEVLIGTILNHLYNSDCVSAVKIAQIAQYAENVFFGKPSGLMDQMACSVGGFVAIDFKNADCPLIERVDFDFDASGHALCIVDSRADHADLTPEYAAIPDEMRAVAAFFDCKVLREIQREDVTINVNELRRACGDRAVLRALHFFDENARVDRLVHSLKNGDFASFLNNVSKSGDSSYRFLQNIHAVGDARHQAVALALYVTEHVLDGRGASRVHGGGFAGTIQAFVPAELLDQYKVTMEGIYGRGSCHVLSVRPYGGVEVTELG